MIGPYESGKELIKYILYWQKRALEAEKWLEDEADYIEELIDTIMFERFEHEREIMEYKKKMYKATFIVGGE